MSSLRKFWDAIMGVDGDMPSLSSNDTTSHRSVLRTEGQTGESGHSVTFDPVGRLTMTPDAGWWAERSYE